MKSILKTLYQYSKNIEIKKLIFDAFSEDNDSRYCISFNENTPISIIELLSKDKIIYIRASIAENPRTPIHILEKLSKDEKWNVRYWVARNFKTPVSILEKLNNDEDICVRAYASRALENKKLRTHEINS